MHDHFVGTIHVPKLQIGSTEHVNCIYIHVCTVNSGYFELRFIGLKLPVSMHGIHTHVVHIGNCSGCI